MNNFKIIIEHDCFSRKPIFITFKVSLVEKSTGNVLHSDTFKERNLHYGLFKARKFEETFLKPNVILGLLAADTSQRLGFQVDKSQGFEKFIADMFEHSSTEYLKEYLKRTKHPGDIESIKNELKKRGRLHYEEDVCIGSIGK